MWQVAPVDDRDTEPAQGPLLTAYRLHPGPALRIIPAPAGRTWMSQTHHHFASRCLPLLMANQAGWLLVTDHALCVRWDGGDGLSSLQVERPDGQDPPCASSHFGHGILTFHIPYLFRTPPGYNLLVRGPSNWPKDGIAPLEGLVETDWASATFTMNWKMTRPGVSVVFDMDEPICMLVPVRRGELETFAPQVRPLEQDPDLQAAFESWKHSRGQFLKDLQTPGSRAAAQGWQKDYFHGKAPDGIAAPEHQKKLHLRPFTGMDDSPRLR